MTHDRFHQWVDLVRHLIACAERNEGLTAVEPLKKLLLHGLWVYDHLLSDPTTLRESTRAMVMDNLIRRTDGVIQWNTLHP